jgi:hypothetical protein
MITQKELKERLHYDPATGIFTCVYLVKNNKRKIGDVVGSIDAKGYLVTSVKGKLYKCHRLAWLYINGTFPLAHIDHIDGNPLNNAWVNLRKATSKQNQENVKLRKDNTSGFRGVIWHKATKKWCATLRHNKKTVWLGLYKTPDEAAIVVQSKRAELFTHDHGRDRGAA